MKKEFYSNGKLLITGEYTVLDGAKALALPTKFGQSLTVTPSSKKQIEWTSFDHDGTIWLHETLLFEEIKNHDSAQSEENVRNTLLKILHEAYLLNPKFINEASGFKITTTLTFPRFWGLGTSSTLINNIAQWASVDAFQLLDKSFGGSGYDIANAQHSRPIFYQKIDGKPTVSEIDFSPSFSENLYFIYLNKKQSSKDAINAYYAKRSDIAGVIERINDLTVRLSLTESIADFSRYIDEHEEIMSTILETDTVKQRYFPDFKGSIKSLGAWGGDFILAVSDEEPSPYFHSRGFATIIPYKEMIL